MGSRAKWCRASGDRGMGVSQSAGVMDWRGVKRGQERRRPVCRAGRRLLTRPRTRERRRGGTWCV